MITEHVCDKCQRSFTSKKDLERHRKRRYPCDAGLFTCENCTQTFTQRSSRDHHRRHTCKGSTQTIAGLQAQLEQCKLIIAATGRLGERAVEGSTSNGQTTNVGTVQGDVIEGDKITNIYNNIVVLPAGNECTDHIRQMSMEELREKIGLQPNDSTMEKLFALVRLDENHPENHTLLLPDLNGKEIHYKTKTGWEVGDFNNRMHAAFCDDTTLLTKIYPEDQRNDLFYDGFLYHDLLPRIGSSKIDDSNLKPLGNKLRPRLHELAVRLAQKYTPETTVTGEVSAGASIPIPPEAVSESQLRLQLALEELRLKTREEETRSRKEETRTLELQLELERERKRII